MKSGDRVRWSELTSISGAVVRPAGTGTIIASTNFHDLVRSDRVIRTHTRPDGSTWEEHELLKFSPANLEPE